VHLVGFIIRIITFLFLYSSLLIPPLSAAFSVQLYLHSSVLFYGVGVGKGQSFFKLVFPYLIFKAGFVVKQNGPPLMPLYTQAFTHQQNVSTG